MRQSLLTCPQCGSMLAPEAIAAGRPARCGQCGTVHLIAAFEPALREAFHPEYAEAAVDPAESTCYYHPPNRAASTCEACGRILCRLCGVQLLEQPLCPPCLTRQMEEAPALRRFYPRNDLLALLVACLPLSLMLLVSPLLLVNPALGAGMMAVAGGPSVLLLAPMATVLALRSGRRMDKPAGGRNWAFALTLALCGTLLLGLLILLLVSIAPFFFIGEAV